MAQQITVMLEDDMNGGTADETVTFALDGLVYEIDLSFSNAGQLREALKPYMAAGRRKGRTRTNATPARTANRNGRDIAAIRAWAAQQGLVIATRGRVPNSVMLAYDNRDTTDAAAFLRTALRLFSPQAAKTVEEQTPASTLPTITDADRAHAESDPKAASSAAVERLSYAREHDGFFPTQGGSMSSSAVVALIRKGFGEDTEEGRRVNGAGLALLELAEEKAAAKARGK